MKEIYSFECGKQTEKDIKTFFGLPAEVSKSGQIDMVFDGYEIEIKRGACILYAGKAFNHYRKANNALQAFKHSDLGTALLRSEKIAYSFDGTIQQTYIMSVWAFMHYAERFNAVQLLKMGKGKKQLRLYPNKQFTEFIQGWATPVTKWKAGREELMKRRGE